MERHELTLRKDTFANYANNNSPLHPAIEFGKNCNVNTTWPRARSRGFATLDRRSEKDRKAQKLDATQSRYGRIFATSNDYNQLS